MSFPYKYKVKWCPVCNQGWVEIVKDDLTGEPLLCCDECEAVWNTPEKIEGNNYFRAEIVVVEPREIDIEKCRQMECMGWK